MSGFCEVLENFKVSQTLSEEILAGVVKTANSPEKHFVQKTQFSKVFFGFGAKNFWADILLGGIPIVRGRYKLHGGLRKFSDNKRWGLSRKGVF